MIELCHELGFKEIIHWKSGTEAYPECLNLATIGILERFPDRPLLLLEDDVDFQGLREFEVPDDADAIYLGLSKCGGSKVLNHWYGDAKLEPYSSSQVRVLNMLATHAIYYHSANYRKFVATFLKSNIGYKYNTDILISRIQPCFQVYANKKPLFYQSNRFNEPLDMETVTRFELK